VAKLCAELGCGHVVNNAYGVQSAALCAALTTACRRGRVDAFVQSTDKNMMVPVGGAIVAAPRSDASLVRAMRVGVRAVRRCRDRGHVFAAASARRRTRRCRDGRRIGSGSTPHAVLTPPPPRLPPSTSPTLGAHAWRRCWTC
jgi:hypothetical protein